VRAQAHSPVPSQAREAGAGLLRIQSLEIKETLRKELQHNPHFVAEPANLARLATLCGGRPDALAELFAAASPHSPLPDALRLSSPELFSAEPPLERPAGSVPSVGPTFEPMVEPSAAPIQPHTTPQPGTPSPSQSPQAGGLPLALLLAQAEQTALRTSRPAPTAPPSPQEQALVNELTEALKRWLGA
jgi:hypothetical protein